jgi:hypothetical protein
MQRLIEAAKELTRYLWKVQDWSGTYVEKCLDNIDAAISDAEQEAADDALPIDEQFIYSIAEQHEAEANELNYPRIQLRGGEMSLEWCVTNGSIELRVAIEDQIGGIDAIEIDVPHIKTRGQLRRLVAALKGGEA